MPYFGIQSQAVFSTSTGREVIKIHPPELGIYAPLFHRKSKLLDFSDIEVPMNKVIISVNPSSDVNLKNLAKNLEIEEQKKETRLFNYGKTQRRSRDKVREGYENEKWCDNDNPWYDGKIYDYTIVDSPKDVFSLLTMDEIKEITLNFTKPMVKKNSVRYLFYFSFNESHYKDFCNVVNDDNKFELFDNFPKGNANYFLPYVQKYLFSLGRGSDKLPHSTQYKFSFSRYIYLDKASDKISFHQNEIDDLEGTLARVNETKMVLFRYGVGFFIVDLEVCGDDIPIEEFVIFNKSIDNHKNEIFNCLSQSNRVSSLNNTELSCDRIFTYTAIELVEETYHNGDFKETAYKVCNNVNWEDSFTLSDYKHDILDKVFLKVEDYILYAFSKTGAALVVANDSNQIDNRSIKLDSYWKNYFNTDFYILLLSLYQRNTLMNFSHTLSDCEAGVDHKLAKGLRRDFLNFTTQSWFSQITEDEMGMEIYKRWQEVFENTILYQEVDKQISEVDEYNKALVSRKVEILSTILLPLISLGLLFDVGLLEGSPVISIKGAGVGVGYLAIALLFGTLWRISDLFKK